MSCLPEILRSLYLVGSEMCIRDSSRAYIRHLLKAKEMLGMRLCVLHNLYFYNTMMTEIRDALDAGRFAEYKKQKLDSMATPLE